MASKLGLMSINLHRPVSGTCSRLLEVEFVNRTSVTEFVDILRDIIHHARSGDEYEYLCSLVPIRATTVMGIPIREPRILDL